MNSPYGICLGAQRQSDQRRRARRGADPRGPPPPEHQSDSEVLLNVFASELQRVGTPRVTPADIFAARQRRVPALPRRLRGGRDGHRPRHARLSRPATASARWCSASGARARGTEYMLASESVALDMPVASSWCATSRPGEAVFIDEQGRLHTQQCVAHGAPHALHLRVRVLRAPRLDHRQHLGVPRAHAHGRAAGREDPARAPRSRHRRGDPDSRHQPHQRAAAGAAPRA